MRFPRFLKKLLILLALLFVGWSIIPVFAAEGANNFAAMSLMQNWEGIPPEMGFPQCKPANPVIKGERFLNVAKYLEPEGKDTLNNQGRIAWLRGACDAAEVAWKKSLEISPQDERNAIWLFWLDDQKVKSLVGKEKLAAYFGRLGTIAQAKHAIQPAIDWYQLSFELYPSYSVSLSLVSLYKQTEQVEQARMQLQETAKLVPANSPGYWWAVGQLAEIDKDWEAALQAYIKGATLADDPYDFYIRQAKVLERLDRWDQVEAAYQAAVDADPHRVLGYIGMGNIQRRNHNFQGALNWFEKAKTLEPDYFLPKFMLGELYFENDELEEAEDYFEKVLLLNPEHDITLYYLAQIYYLRGESARAIATLSRAISHSQDDRWRWLVMLGDWQEKAGDLSSALQSYYTALSADPENTGIINHIGVLNKKIREQK